MAYLVDANVFIAAKNLHYGLDFCPAFWDWLAREHAAGKVFSVEKVVDELRAGGDELAEWVARMPDAFSLKPDASTAGSLATVAQWINAHTQYSAAAKSTFLQIADYYPCGGGAGRRSQRRYPRGSAEFRAPGQDPQRVPWTQRALPDALRDAAPRAGAVCLGEKAMKRCSGSFVQQAQAAMPDAALAANRKELGYGG
jgi:hypothetical protein